MRKKYNVLFANAEVRVLLIFLDSETGGLNCHIHRILEIAFQVLDSSFNQSLCTYSSLIKHESEVWLRRSEESFLITELTEEYVNERGKTEDQVSEEISSIFECYGIKKDNAVFICQNPALDRVFFSQLISTEVQHARGWPYHWLDLASMFWAIQGHDRIENSSLNMLTKDNIAKHLGIGEEQKPHRALRGVEHLIACYRVLIQGYQVSESCNLRVDL